MPMVGRPIKVLDQHGYQAFARYDYSAGVYEIFASQECDDYVGCADSISEARDVAKAWADERRNG